MLEELWAKTREDGGIYPLHYHLLDAASAMRVVWDEWLRPGLKELLIRELGPQAREIACFTAGVHDIGKANPVFALQLASNRDVSWIAPIRNRLSELGYQSLDTPYRKSVQPMLRRHEQVAGMHLTGGVTSNVSASVSGMALAALGHHGRFVLENPKVALFETVAGGKWAESRDTLVAEVRAACCLTEEQTPDTIRSIATILLSGLVVLADRLASHTEAIDDAVKQMEIGALDPDQGTAWIAARGPYFKDLLQRTLGLYQDFSDPIESILAGNSPRQVQERACSVGDGLWLVMTATGSGKTEAALLRHAKRPESLCFLLPTQATTNAVMRRLQRIYRTTNNVATLAHGMAALEGFYTMPQSSSPDDTDSSSSTEGLFPTQFVRHGSARLLAPITVGTVDQALMASLPLKWTHLRLLALANSHVVIDEAHTLDEYQTRLLEPLLMWLGATGTRVTILTATLPTVSRDAFAKAYAGGVVPKEPVRFPSTMAVDGRSSISADDVQMGSYGIDLELEQSDDSVQAHVTWVNAFMSKFPQGRVGVFVNTIDRAQEISASLAATGHDVIVLHSRMTALHRQQAAQQLETKIGRHGTARGLVVVGTQAIEASLDIDLDAATSDLAPAASLIQRAGRVWRHSDDTRAERIPGLSVLLLRIVRDTSDYGHYPYPAAKLERTWNYLGSRKMLQVPDDVQEFIETGTLSLEEVLTDHDFEELAGISLAGQAGKQAAIDLRRILAPDAKFTDFASLTEHANGGADSDEEYPRTRLIDHETCRVIITHDDPTVTPGAWVGDRESLLKIDGKESTEVKRALTAIVPVSNGKVIRQILTTMQPLDDCAGSLLGVLAGPLPAGLRYDPHAGLIKVEQNGTL